MGVSRDTPIDLSISSEAFAMFCYVRCVLQSDGRARAASRIRGKELKTPISGSRQAEWPTHITNPSSLTSDLLECALWLRINLINCGVLGSCFLLAGLFFEISTNRAATRQRFIFRDNLVHGKKCGGRVCQKDVFFWSGGRLL